MDKFYILKQLEKNEESHNELNNKIESINEKINKNHIELLNAINLNTVENEKMKAKYGLMGGFIGAITIIGDLLIKKI